MIDWVNDMLHGWGYWARKQRYGGLGYAPTYPAYREYQPPTGNVYSGIPEHFNEYELLDKIVAALPNDKANPCLTVVALRYRDRLEMTVIAKTIEASRQTAHAKLDLAHAIIAETIRGGD